VSADSPTKDNITPAKPVIILSRNKAGGIILNTPFNSKNKWTTIDSPRYLATEYILPLYPEHFPEIESGGKIAEYRSYEMPNVTHLWLYNTETRQITHSVNVEPPWIHTDQQPDDTLK
jgi:hypothetical protein